MQQFQAVTKSATGASTALANSLKSVAANMAIMLAINLVIKAATIAWDNFNHTVEEQNEIINDLKSSYEELKSEHQQLSEKQDLTDSEKRRLEYLEKRLELDEKILAAEQKQLFDEKTENNFSNRFDKKNWNTIRRDLESSKFRGVGKSTLSDLRTYTDSSIIILDKVRDSIQQYQELLNGQEVGSSGYDAVAKKLQKALLKEEEILGDLTKYEDEFLNIQGDVFDYMNDAEEVLNSDYATDSQKTTAQGWFKTWQGYYDQIKEYIVKIKKESGTYEETFDDRIDSIGKGNLAEINKLKNYTKDFSDEEKEVWLQATVGAENATDAINKYEESVKNATNSSTELNEATLPFNIQTTVDNLNTKLKPALNAIGAEYQKMFTSEGFTLDDVDITETLSNIKSQFDNLKDKLELDVDYSSFEGLADALSTTTGDAVEDAKRVQEAWNSVATEIILATSGSFENLDATSIEVLHDALEDLGVATMSLYDATTGEITQLEIEAMTAEQTAQAIVLLQLQKALANDTQLDTVEGCRQLYNLAVTANASSEALDLLNKLIITTTRRQDLVANGASNDVISAIDRTIATIKLRLKNTLDLSDVKVDFSKLKSGGSGGSGSSAKDAGKDAGDDYKQGLQDALSDLDKIISYVSNKLSKQIDGLNDAKKAAEDALKAEKDAALEAIQAQIDSTQAIIDAKQKEIDAIEKANKKRQQAIDLQKAEYDLARQLNQKTVLLYSEEKGMYYTQDTSGLRDARDKVQDAKDEIAKQSLQDEIDLLTEQKEALEKQKDAISDYYDELIEKSNAYYDALIENLEKQKSKFEEIKEIQEEAQQKALFEKYGIDEEALLAGSEEEFNKLKDMYTSLSNELQAIESGAVTTGTALAELGKSGSSVSATSDAVSDLNDNLESTGKSATTTATSLGEVSESAKTSAESVDKIAESTSKIAENVKPASEALQEMVDSLNELGGENSLESLFQVFTNLGIVIEEIRLALNGADQSVFESISNLNSISLEELVKQFSALSDSVTSVASAIGGAVGGNADSSGMSGGSNSGSSGGINDALDNLKSKADEVLGSGSGQSEMSGESEGGSSGQGVIGQFDTLADSVSSVTTAIGSSGETGESDSGSGEDESNLIGAIGSLGETASEIIGSKDDGSETVNGKFGEMEGVIDEARQHIVDMKEAMEELNGAFAECTIKVNLEVEGGGLGTINSLKGASNVTGSAIDGLRKLKIESAEYNANFGSAHVEGTANVRGDWSVHQGGKSLVGEMGRELLVRNGRFQTIGDNGAEMIDLKQGDIIFNHKQTEELLKNGRITSRGKAYSNGTVGKSYADGTPMNMATLFAGEYRTLAQIKKLQEEMVKQMKVINSSLNRFAGSLDLASGTINNISNVTSKKEETNINIGDIHVHEVQNVRDFAQVVVSKFSNAMLQELHRN